MDYLTLHLISGLKVGDTVKVIGSCIDRAFGWKNSWNPEMENAIGQTFLIKEDLGENGFLLDTSDLLAVTYSFPAFLLQKIEDVPKPNYPMEIFTLLELPLSGNVIGKIEELTESYNEIIDRLGVSPNDAIEEIDRLQVVDTKMEDLDLDDMERKVERALEGVEEAISSLHDSTSELEDIDFS